MRGGHRRGPAATRWCRAAGLLAASAWLAAPLHAQTPPAAPAAQPAASPAAEAPVETVPVAEISARAQRVIEEVRALSADLAKNQEGTDLEADFEQLSGTVKPRALETADQLTKSLSLNALSNLRLEWTGLERQIAEREARIGRWIASLEARKEGLSKAREMWRRTRERERERGTPQPILESARNAASALKDGVGALGKALEGALVLQNRFAELHATAQETLMAVRRARDDVLEQLLVRDEPPLWQLDLVAEVARGSWPIPRYVADLRETTQRFASQNAESIALQLLLFVFLAWGLLRTHHALRRTVPVSGLDDAETRASHAALLATQHPLAAAALLALLATPLFLEGLPPQLITALRISLMPPLVVVLRPILGDALRRPLYLLAIFFLIDQFRGILIGAPAPARVLFTLEMLVLAGVLAALLTRRRLELLPDSVRGDRWLAALGVWIRFCVPTALAAGAADVFGYTRLANLLGGGVLGSGYAALGGFALSRIGLGIAAALLAGEGRWTPRMLSARRASFLVVTSRVLRAAILVAWVLIVADLFAVRDPLFRSVGALLSTRLGYGSFEFSVGGVVAFLLTLAGAWLLARLVHLVLDEEVFPRIGLARGVPFALATLARYAILIVGFLVALSALGFDLDRITILLGAFGVGIGFGLQTIVNNFVSGLILLFERPVKVGDWVEIGGLEGIVQRIGIRASTVRTFDGADVIVPNGALISDRVVNWTLSDRSRRVVIPVGVAYGSDLRQVMHLLQEMAAALPGVCAYPKPVVAFVGFGDSSLDFQVRAWIDDADTLIEMRSQLGLAIERTLREAGIEIPFPQRTVHLQRDAAPAGGAGSGDEPPPAQRIARE